MIDSADEFQFKPLTEGLGFHNRHGRNQDKSPGRPQPTEFKTSGGLDHLISSNTSGLEMLETPLPRKNTSQELPQRQKSTVDEILRTLQERRKLTFKEDARKTAPLPEAKWTASSWELPAAILDLMLVVALQMAALISLLAITKIDLFANLSNPDSEGMIYLSLFAFFASFVWIYMVASRVFMGCTPGEWVFDQRIGKPDQMGSSIYSMKVLARASLVVASGFIIFPFLSVLFDKDLLGKMTGLELVKRV